MYNNLYVLKYNNHFNREIRSPLPLVTDYQDYIYQELANVNFNEGDGVSTTLEYVLPIEDGDYLLVADSTGNVVSRWFILDHDRICRGQNAGMYRLQLYRDVIADNYNAVLSSKCYVEKAILDDENPLIYNKEPISVNAIRQSGDPLIDDSKMAWIVGFVSRKSTQTETIAINSTVVPDFEVDSLEDWPYYKYVGHTVTMKLDGVTRAYVRPFVSRDYQVATFTSTKVTVKTDPNSTFSNYFYEGSSYDFKRYLLSNKARVNGKVAQSIPDYFTDLPDYQNDNDYIALFKMKGKIIEVGTNTYYKIDYDETPYSQDVFITEDKGSSNLYTTLQEVFKGYEKYVSGDGRYKVSIGGTKRTLKLTPVVEGEYTIDFPDKGNRLINKNAPFDVFYLPYSDEMSIHAGDTKSATGTTIQANKQFAMSIASELGRSLNGECYDIQLLPYTTMTGYTVTDKLFDINSKDPKRYTPIKKGDQVVYWLFWSTSSEKSFSIQHPILLDNVKMDNQCDTYRLCSPNYNGLYEFNAAKNEGVDYFNVDITYLPYSSYIHVVPQLKGLYGNYTDQPIGLICQGDFSITYVSEAWKSFVLNNKNYNAIWSREIENLDKIHDIQVQQQRIGAWASALSKGVIVGSNVNVGAGIGAGLISGIAGEADIRLGERVYQENKAYKSDIRDYQLDNIKSLPYSIAKTTAYTKNNQLFPVLEKYSCTDEEKRVVADEIINYSMTVGAIGSPVDYVDNSWSYQGRESRGYFKGQLIKIDLNDTHLTDAIAGELARGVYFK